MRAIGKYMVTAMSAKKKNRMKRTRVMGVVRSPFGNYGNFDTYKALSPRLHAVISSTCADRTAAVDDFECIMRLEVSVIKILNMHREAECRSGCVLVRAAGAAQCGSEARRLPGGRAIGARRGPRGAISAHRNLANIYRVSKQYAEWPYYGFYKCTHARSGPSLARSYSALSDTMNLDTILNVPTRSDDPLVGCRTVMIVVGSNVNRADCGACSRAGALNNYDLVAISSLTIGGCALSFLDAPAIGPKSSVCHFTIPRAVLYSKIL
ncbi:hypothetical protein EVAR_67173_1 [Eumeta japonica]|uniref:Uncharacterized protein n=1 Tax=Eumeta variegata TaxID=151549 RepID=A0A4C1ZXR7_EUMVA|nr:hypothetical protein EVAR_67173_1 [Eumeta japonica]